MLCKDTIFLVRFQILPLDLGRFSAQIRRIDVFNIEDAHARAELMRAWFRSRLIASFERNVIHDPRIRNFRVSKITFRRLRARWAVLPIL